MRAGSHPPRQVEWTLSRDGDLVNRSGVYLQHIAPAAAVAEATVKTAHLAVQP